ncbi:MAG: hypothetical protein ACRET0_00160 [Steroidobacteraceae bacterium]
MNHLLRQWAVLATLTLLGGCASENIRVRCGAHLQPINPSSVQGAGRTDGVARPKASAVSAAPKSSGDRP